MTETLVIAFLFSLAAGLSTGLGSLVAFFIKDFKQSYLLYCDEDVAASFGVLAYTEATSLTFGWHLRALLKRKRFIPNSLSRLHI
jgi:hypothetical protein